VIPIIITISGLTGSGKNTLGELLARRLGYRLVCPTFKDLAAREGISLMEFQKKAEKDPDIDRKFDALLKEEAGKGDCVVTTWLGPWMVDADVRIKVKVADSIRAERIARRDGMAVAQALEHLRKRDDQNRMRYRKLYGIDIDDEKIFDAVLNGGRNPPEKLLEMALRVIEAKKAKN
jgi:cytidylate kinase